VRLAAREWIGTLKVGSFDTGQSREGGKEDDTLLRRSRKHGICSCFVSSRSYKIVTSRQILGLRLCNCKGYMSR
jgi:hypothetical protein